MGLQQSVGAAIAVSATLPTTFDSTGFAALTYTKLGKLNGYPDLDGTRDIATFDNLETGEEEKFGDVFRAGNSTFNVGLDPVDAGQIIVEAAKDANTKLAMEFTLKDGTIYYRQAIVTSFRPAGIGTGNIVLAAVGLEFEKTTIKVAA